jgi:hypothetical protein
MARPKLGKRGQMCSIWRLVSWKTSIALAVVGEAVLLKQTTPANFVVEGERQMSQAEPMLTR